MDSQNILILGYGGNSRNIGIIKNIDTYNHLCDLYNSDSNLAEVYKILSDFGCTDISVMNLSMDDINSYVDAIEIIKQFDFKYVIPADVYIGNTYYDTTTCTNIHLLDYMVKTMYGCNETVIVATDKHASLYEDIDNFLDDMAVIESGIEGAIGLKNHGENLLFVANNLEDFKFANAVLVAAIDRTAVNQYPVSDKFGNAIFDIDFADIKNNSMIYFRSHDDRSTTIENLLNLNSKVKPQKIVTINRILKYMLREMDFSEFDGKFYTDYQKLQVKKKLIKYMDIYTGFILTDYKINSVDFYKTGPSVGIIVSKISVWPINCFESCDLKVQINNS